ncbi:MAG: UDP-2,3-diacylglucosamine diphosphatase [Campylobacter sp.]|nr:UDP-2,3-diacylglucosamine diphosphatase [Campylobacter sp.]
MARIFKIEDGAIFISDSHANSNRPQFYEFLKYVNSLPTQPSQIFMLGDMFDFLANTAYSQKFYKKEIDLINEISQKCEIFYFEGNHDFNLKNIFPNVEIFAHKNQPVFFKSEFDDTFEIAHGDIFSDQPAPMCLRNNIFLSIANFVDRICNFSISKNILKKQSQKSLDRKIENFANIIGKKIHKYGAKTIIEGHYHQDRIVEFGGKNYMNLSSFALTQQVYKFKAKKNEFVKISFEFK